MNWSLPDFEVIDDETAAKYRAMTPAEKIQLIGDLNLQARERGGHSVNAAISAMEFR